jgi:phenylalanine-specific permease
VATTCLPALILLLMCTIDGMRLSATCCRWILFLFIVFKLLRRPA